VPFTSASRTADSNAIHPYQGIRLFLRGAKGEGLGYLPYTPSPVTITQSGPLNQGNISVTLQKGSGSNQDYNMIGNTYPSPVDIGTVLYTAKAAGQITGSAFYVWNPAMGAAGQFQAHSIGVGAAIPYYLAANSAFQVRAAFSGAVLNFTEENKHETAGAVLFRSVSATVALGIYNNAGQLWDRLDIRFNQQASDAEDCDYDAAKLHGPGFNFYSLTPDRKKLAIDVRKYTNSTTIPLGLASDYEGIFTIRVESAMLPDDGKLYLHDRTTEQYTDLLPGTEYKFSVTKDNRTQGDERFELTTVTHLNPTNNTLLQCTLQPNPATNEVTVAIVGAPAAETNVSITNTAGTLVYQKNFGHQSAVKQTIPLSGLASGWYMVQITNGPESICKKLIKE
jgi:hypothetical protein